MIFKFALMTMSKNINLFMYGTPDDTFIPYPDKTPDSVTKNYLLLIF